MKTNLLKAAAIALITVFFGSTLLAQDIHFSAMDYSPLTLNPAMAGAKYDLQATANYRNQWSAVATPYQTIGLSYDMRFGTKSKAEKGYFAAGINFYNDNVGENKIATNSLALSAAYHLKLNQDNHIGLALQGRFANRSFSHTNGRWGNQYDGTAYNENLPSGETFKNASFNFFDVGAGLVYSYTPQQKSVNNNGTSLQIGFATYHINQPKYSFIKDEGDKLYMRMTAFAMAEIGIGNKKMALEPQIIAQFQGPSLETFLGTDYRFFLGQGRSTNGFYDGTSLAIGLFYRNQDALMTRISVRYGGFDLGVMYDFNIFSSLKQVSNTRGAFEIYLRYILQNPFSMGSKARI